MRATILLGTLKPSGLSHTGTLCEFFTEVLRERDVECEIVKLVEHEIPPGTYSDMGAGDQWPQVLEKLLRSEIIVLATPIWWSNQSSLIQRAIERLDEIHDRIMAGERSPLEGKAGGVVITGDSDGAQQIIGHIANFLIAIGVVVPPYATLSVLWERQGKHANPTREELWQKYQKDYRGAAERMAEQLIKFARASGS